MESLVKIPELTFSTSLKSHVLYEVLYDKALTELKKIPNIFSFKLSNEFTVLVCTLVENAVKKKDKIDKKKLVISILTVLFSLTDPEKLIISTQIEYILSNTDLIKKVIKPYIVRAYRKLSKLVLKKE